MYGKAVRRVKTDWKTPWLPCSPHTRTGGRKFTASQSFASEHGRRLRIHKDGNAYKPAQLCLTEGLAGGKLLASLGSQFRWHDTRRSSGSRASHRRIIR